MLLFRFFWFLIDLGISDDHLSVWHYIPKHSTKRGAIDRKWLLSGVRERYIYLHIYCWVFIIGFFFLFLLYSTLLSPCGERRRRRKSPQRERARERFTGLLCRQHRGEWTTSVSYYIAFEQTAIKKKKSVFLVGCQSHHLALPDSNVYI